MVREEVRDFRHEDNVIYIIAGFKDGGRHMPRNMRMSAVNSQQGKRKFGPILQGTEFNQT